MGVPIGEPTKKLCQCEEKDSTVTLRLDTASEEIEEKIAEWKQDCDNNNQQIIMSGFAE